MGFLGDLADSLNASFGVGENATRSVDLGDFAKQIDKSEHRRYVEEGYLRKDQLNVSPKAIEILMQEPNATVLVKKRMFSSIAENYRPDYMDQDEKLYFKAIKILFQNKCKQISALEKLSKIQKITSAVGNISDQLVPIIISLTDDAGSGFSDGGFNIFGGINGDGEVSQFTKVVDRIRRIYAFNTTSNTTSWITDSTNLFQTQYGQGTGVIEITNFTNFSCGSTLDIRSPGTINLSISDPYEAMLITEYYIERAINEATSAYFNSKVVQFGQEAAETIINDLMVELNQLRSDRGASSISFKQSPDTLVNKKLVAIIDRMGIELPFTYDAGFGGLGGSVSISNDYLKGGQIAGPNGLDTDKQPTFGANSLVRKLVPDSELSIFKKLVAAIYNQMQLQTNMQTIFQTNNQNTNYVRRKMRFSFLGKLIIQPMDSLHVYINSKSRYDTKLMTGITNMFSGFGILQNLNKTVIDFKNAFDTLFNPSGSIQFQVEKINYVGPDFPNSLWSLIRSQFTTENEGTHVFGGIVNTASSAWNDGKFTVSVNGTDNSAYFEMGRINFKPGVDTFNGSLFDPLTPFKTRFDRISSTAKNDTPELLDENKFLLGTEQDTDSPIVKFKGGPFAGQRVNQSNYLQDKSIDPNTGFMTRTFYAPDGLVYKWKEGIGVLTQFGNSLELNNPLYTGNPALTQNPFAGQDTMNVISLLITGQPYNFATYWKAVSNFDGFNKDPNNQQDSAYSYYASLKNDLIKANVIWGNFIPFKNLVMDEQSYAQALQAQFRVLQRNSDLDAKLQQLASLRRDMVLFGTGADLFQQDSNYASNFTKARAEVDRLTADIKGLLLSNAKENQSFSYAQNINNDVSQDFSTFIDSTKINLQASDPNIRRNLRRQLNYLTRRMSYNVRGNEDKNLFIVDDFYDKDYDLIAYDQALTDGLKLFNNEFSTVKDKICATADLLNLEVFCDTQGHIRVRPPQYNRMPSSVFYKMMYLKKTQGIQIFPQFIDDLFTDQINALSQRLGIIEDQIRLDCAVLGINSDTEATSFILSNGPITGMGETFSFISNQNTGEISNFDKVLEAANPDAEISEETRTFTSLERQAKSNKLQFDNDQKVSAILNSLTKQKLDQSGYGINDIPQFSANSRIDDLIQRIQTVSGLRIPKSSYLVQAENVINNDISIPVGISIDVFKVVQELSEKIRERQKILKLLYGSIKNATEFRSLDANENIANDLVYSGAYNNTNIPEVFEHMIEDEQYDDYGVGSGSRYIIKRAQIKNLNIQEQAPDYTYIQVRGVQNPFAPNAVPAEFNSFPDGGNGLVTAHAIDYDMWRSYGLRDTPSINVPFLSDPNSQCAPYASMILSRARRNTLRGTLTISGNEFMQPGEVIYLEDRNLLFYVSSVRHEFNFGSSFTTTMELTYGHPPGEYIPVMLDVIGKLIYNNRDTSSFVVQRQFNSFNDANIGVIQKDSVNYLPNQIFNTGEEDNVTTSFSAANAKTINNILYTTAYQIRANNTKGNTIKASVEIRIYYDDLNPISSDMLSFADAVKDALTLDQGGPKQIFNANTNSARNPTLDKNDVNIVEINMSDENEFRSPSQAAIDAARNQLQRTGAPATGTFQIKDKIRFALFNYLVDCWIKFEPVKPQEANSSLNNIELGNSNGS